MHTYQVLHLQATNDRNGNPRRGFVVLFNDGQHAYFDEGYHGFQAIPADYRDRQVWPVRVTVGELRRWERTSNNVRKAA